MPLADWASIGVRPKRKVCLGVETVYSVDLGQIAHSIRFKWHTCSSHESSNRLKSRGLRKARSKRMAQALVELHSEKREK